MLRAERILSSSTDITPVKVFSTTIKKVAYIISAIFDCSPMPNQTRNSVMKAIGGMKRMKFRNGSAKMRMAFTFPIISPAGTASRLPSTQPTNTR
ncbi:hypothetical protein D3C73_1140470 [compost metagenome]